MKDEFSILRMYAVTPCHAGSGSALGVVDLPIQRERHTNWPVIQASGMKGAMRAHFERFKKKLEDEAGLQLDQITDWVFGSEKSEFAGSLSVSDAKVLAFPMRSSVAPFVWITCPAVLKRLAKDFRLAGRPFPADLAALGQLGKNAAWCWDGAITGAVLLEDMEVTAAPAPSPKEFGDCFQGAERLLVVHDEVFGYGVSHCTSVVAQIAIDQATGTTQSGSLRYVEELPSDTLLYAVVAWGDCRAVDEKEVSPLAGEAIRGFVRDKVMKTHLQVGGDETLGRGIFELSWM